MMNYIELPIYHRESPIIGLQYFSLSIIYGDENILPWFFSNYIQLEWDKNSCIWFSLLDINYASIPFLDTQIIYRDFIKCNNYDIESLIIDSIMRGYYIQLCLNEFYVPEKEAHNNSDFIHDNLIIGFDNINQKFTLLGYNKRNKLSLSYVSYNDFTKAFITVDSVLTKESGVVSIDYASKVFILKKRDDVSYKIDKELIKESLIDFLEGNSFDIKFRMISNPDMNKTFGLNIYVKLSHSFIKRESEIINDIRFLHIIYEHKKVMILRIKYLYENNIIKKDYEVLDKYIELENEVLSLRNLQIKYFIKKDVKNLDKIAEGLIKVHNKEKMVLNNLISLF